MTDTVAGEHQCMLSESNYGSYIPTCSCGWIGVAHKIAVTRDARSRAIKKRHYDSARREAEDDWRRHVVEASASTDITTVDLSIVVLDDALVPA